MRPENTRVWRKGLRHHQLTAPPIAPQQCAVCNHADPHYPVPGPSGWPMKNLKCASCPSGLCVLPDADPDAET